MIMQKQALSCTFRYSDPMLTTQRKQVILELLTRDGGVVAKDLAAHWDVSEDTVRRDLRELAAEGLLQRVHGGALPISAASGDFEARQTVATGEKQIVARLAAGLIGNGQTVFIDGGTTGRTLCRVLPADLRATVITHSPTIAVELTAHPGVDVFLIGGRMYPHSVVATGAVAAEQVAAVSADVFFMGVSGVHHRAGLTTGDQEEAAIKRAISRRSSETYVLASSEKLGTASPFRVIPFGEVTAAITDTTDTKTLRPLRKAGLAVVTPRS
jgi:DeoR/GlpR family transcriptional regulator of sugar metabolism